MRVLILNGSPRVAGDTIFILNQVKEQFPSNTIFEEINAYEDKITPCMDCRYCWENEGCSIMDKMDLIKKDDYDILIIASPIYMSFVTPPLFSVFTRLNYFYSNKHFLNINHNMKQKKGLLILVGGGEGAPDNAINISTRIFKKLNAKFDLEKNYIHSLNTNIIPVREDNTLTEQIKKGMKDILIISDE